MMTPMEIANSAPLWITSGIAVLVVLGQAVVFAVKAYEAGGKVGLSKAQMQKAMKSSAITSIGPSIVVLSGMLSLLVTVGAPIAWMRLSMIGSVMFEAIAAGIGTKVVGVTLGTDQLTNEALTMAIWTMVLCSIGWVVFATFSASRMDMVREKVSGGDTAKLIAISIGAVIGVFGAMCAPHILKMNKSCVACLAGAAIMFIMMKLTEKEQFAFIKEWNLTIAIVLGMVITAML